MEYKTLLLLASGSLLTSSAHAAFFNNSSGLAAPDQTITFESVALTPNQSVTTEFLGEGVTFSNTFGNADLTTVPNFSGNRIGDFQSNIGGTGLFSATFASTLSDVAFALVTAPGTTTFTAFLNGNLVESASAATTFDNVTNFFGFTGIAFNQLTISTVSFDNVFQIDNLQTAAVPIPPALALLGGPLVLLSSLRRKLTGT